MEVFKLLPRTLSGQLRFYMGVAGCAALVLNGWFSYAGSRRALEQQVDALAANRLQLASRFSESFSSRIGTLVATIAARQRAIGPKPSADTVPFLAQVLTEMPADVFSVYVTFDDTKLGEQAADQAVDRISWPAQVPHGARDRHGPGTSWYAEAKAAGALYATRPYFDEGRAKSTMITFTVPVYDAARTVVGMAGADVTLDQFTTIISGLQEAGPEASAYAYLVDRAGRIVIHPSTRLMLRRGFAGADVRALPEGEVVAARPRGFTERRVGHDVRRVYWETIPFSRAKVVLNLSEQKVMRPVVALTARTIAGDAIALAFMLLLVSLIVRRVTRPIRRLSHAVEAVASGNFDSRQVDPLAARRDELGELAQGFRQMAGEIVAREQRLEAWNANLSHMVADRTVDLARALDLAQQSQARLAAELADAAGYVTSLLPPRLDGPVRSDWVFIPSRLLGGDAFGYHWLDERRLAVYLLDVCGHGVGAALLSISVINLLRSHSLPGTDFGDPGAVLTALNQRFPAAEQNEMNFTMWYGVYDHARRELCYATGGHPPAVLVVAGASGERVQELGTPNFMIGMVAGARYESESCPVPPCSRLFVFSDGLYEVCSPSGAWLDFDQFVQMLRARAAPGLSGLEGVLADVRAWQQRDTFEDDCSVVMFEFPGSDSPRSPGTPAEDYTRIAVDAAVIRLSIGNALDDIPHLLDVLAHELQLRRVPASLVHAVETVVDELVANVIRHGFRDDGRHTIDLEVTVREAAVTLRVSDAGIAFDPFTMPLPDITRPVEERPIGGLGIYLVRQLATECHYARVEGRNVVTVTVREPLP
jgi:serine phosphatase RsbU (regulator of sigma subunit)/anti-sigma regulatory factor (Ser/Thr protein kinase)